MAGQALRQSMVKPQPVRPAPSACNQPKARVMLHLTSAGQALSASSVGQTVRVKWTMVRDNEVELFPKMER